jgi:hypothetical protein
MCVERTGHSMPLAPAVQRCAGQGAHQGLVMAMPSSTVLAPAKASLAAAAAAAAAAAPSALPAAAEMKRRVGVGAGLTYIEACLPSSQAAARRCPGLDGSTQKR